MDWITILYFFYTFIAFYFLSVYILVYLQNKNQIYEVIPPKRNYSLSIVVPCYNEAKSIGKNIKSLIDNKYPGLKKIIVVDDCSSDNSYDVIKKYAKKYSQVMAIKTPKNTGKAAGAKNYGAKFVKTELIGFSDADSFARKDAIKNMVGFFNDENTGAVTSRVLVSNRKNKLSKIQAIEYKIIAFTRKLLGFLESIYVTNGPLSIYRKSAYDQTGGFDETNMTEDIEITWHIVSKGWGVQMAVQSKTYTVVPETIKSWFNQRIRWNIGGIQTVTKYRRKFMQCGMLGLFILPFFIFSWFIGLTGLFFLAYRFTRYLVSKYLVAKYSIASQVALVRMEDFSLNPGILFFFGLVLFLLGLTYTLVAIFYSRESDYKKHPLRDIFIYSFFYLLAYPPLLIISFYGYLKGRRKW